MTLALIIRQKRKEANLTQEQVANALGITTPAVNKWEKGTTCPDIALLPALARLLNTDPNTLLSFEKELTKAEVSAFLKRLAEISRENGLKAAFDAAFEKTREYPDSEYLIRAVALLLDGVLIMSELAPKEKREYEKKIITLYERLAKSSDSAMANEGRFMLASKLTAAGEFEKAQSVVDSLPEYSPLDKRSLQADLTAKNGNIAEAAAILEKKLRLSVTDNITTLIKLIRFAATENNAELADALAECARGECAAYALGEYWENIAPMEAAVAMENAKKAVECLRVIFAKIKEPMEVGFSPLFTHSVAKLPGSTKVVVPNLAAPLLSHLKNDPEYEFLRGVLEFEELLTMSEEKKE